MQDTAIARMSFERLHWCMDNSPVRRADPVFNSCSCHWHARRPQEHSAMLGCPSSHTLAGICIGFAAAIVREKAAEQQVLSQRRRVAPNLHVLAVGASGTPSLARKCWRKLRGPYPLILLNCRLKFE